MEILVHLINLFVVGGLVFITATRGLERALPFLAFCMVLIPGDSLIRPIALFDLTTHRIAIATVGFFFLARQLSGRTPTVRFKDPLRYVMLLTVGWTVVSAIFSIVPIVSLKATIALAVEYYFLYYLMIETISSVETIHRILVAIIAAIFVCCVFGVLEAYQSWSVMDLFPRIEHRFGILVGPLLDAERGIRARSTFPHPILFGATLSLAIPLALYLLTRAKTRAHVIALWISVLLMFLNIYKTDSRGPWMALVLSLGLLFVFHRGGMRKALLVTGVLTLLVLTTRPGVVETIWNRYVGTFDPDSYIGASYQYRYALLDVSLEALNRSPDKQLWGYGLRSFYFLGLEGEFQGMVYPFLSCDSSWIELMVETGFVGLLLAALLLLKAAFICWKGFLRLPGPDRYLSLTFFANVIAFCFMMSNVALYGWGQGGQMLWITIAMAVALAKLRASEVIVSRQEFASSILAPQKVT